MRARLVRDGFVAVAALAMAGCGGGGSTTSVQSVPTPPPAPSPTPTPPPPPSAPPPLPAGPIGLQSNAPFATQAAYLNVDGFGAGSNAVLFNYSAADNAYTITLPNFPTGQLVTGSGNGSLNDNGGWQFLGSTNNNVKSGSGNLSVLVTLDWPASSTLTYTSAGTWADQGPFPTDAGIFAYGIPTSVGDVPKTGSANYAGIVRGTSDQSYFVDGSVALSFDFAGGTLSGSMKPALVPWDSIPLGTYTFRDTVYSTGSTTFSGAFDVPASTAPSSFSGNFNGPQAVEFMANWQAPYLDPITGHSGTMAGIWIGKKN